ncbi:MAG: methyltransferase family protein [Candidatus Helarchaeota archaeon]
MTKVISRLEIKEWFAELWRPSKLGEGFTNTGIYRHIRHTLYTGSILFSFGMILIFQTWFGHLLFLYPLTIMLRTSNKEESLLLERFGEPYE